MSKLLAKFFIINFILFFCHGCTMMVTKPTPPSITRLSFSEMGPSEISFPKHPVKPVLQYKSTSKNPIESGYIIAKVNVYSEEMSDKDKVIDTIICACPSGEEVLFPPVSTYMILSLTNRSQRIYNLAQTFIQIEDNQGGEYPIPENLETIIQRTEEGIKEYYQSYKSGAPYEEVDNQYKKIINELKQDNMLIEQHKNLIFGTYAERYRSYKTSHTINTILEFFNPLMYLGLVLSEKWPHESFDRNLGPNIIWNEHKDNLLGNKYDIERSLIERRNRLIDNTHRKIDSMCSECQKKVRKGIDKNQKIIFTSGKFEFIPILPGKTKKIIIPINWKPENAPKRLYCKIYDIVTVTDEASNPIKRDNLSFTFDCIIETSKR